MSVTITASFEAANITELHELLTMIGDNEPIDVQVDGSFHFGYSEAGQHVVDPDDTPPHGTERPYWAADEPAVHEWHEMPSDAVKARELYVSALIAWTREHITDGPIGPDRISNESLRRIYTLMLMYGVDECRFADLISGTQLACVRGAFRDATAGQVPL
jgi:hypothetical protein